MMASVDLFHVPYRGAQVYPALLAGEAQVYFGPLSDIAAAWGQIGVALIGRDTLLRELPH